MNELYPLKFIPIYKEKIWGGQQLKHLPGKSFDPLPNCGESWELSGVSNNISVVENGFLAGNALTELAEVYMGDLLGEKIHAGFGPTFPLLFKFLDAADTLSVQVHPGDAFALERHQSRGKAEMWYVMQAEKGAKIYAGFKRDTTSDEFMHFVREGRLEEILKVEEVSAGDVFYIPPGHIHAIGKGITLCEIQQASDITYRIYDWNRSIAGGGVRKLHLEEAIEVLDFKAGNHKVSYSPIMGEPVELVRNQFFTTRLLDFDQQVLTDYILVDSFVVYVCIEGSFTIVYASGSLEVKTGDTILLPADLKAIELLPKQRTRIIETYIS